MDYLMKNLLIAIDLDGVMVNLDPQLDEEFKIANEPTRTHKALDKVWDQIDENHSFWYNLPPMENYELLYRKILEKCPLPIVLSATPYSYGFDERHERCKAQKIAWVNRYLGPAQALRTIITKSNLKQTFIAKIPADKHVLLDDHIANINRWNAAGGHGIHHTSYHTSLSELESL